MARRKEKFDFDVTRKLAELRDNMELYLTEAAKYFGYKRYETVRSWELGLSRCPTTKRHQMITYLLRKLGLESNEEKIKEFLKLWEELMVMQWEWDPLDLGELEVYLPDKMDILAKLFETLTARVPLDRPAPIEHFVGRKTELNQLVNNLKPGRVVALVGPGGVGKTALASKAIWTVAPDDDPPDSFPDGIISHNYYSEPQTTIVLEKIIEAFEEKPMPTLVAAAQRALAGRRALLVLDGTEAAVDLGTVLDVRGNCCVLLTSRSRKDLSFADYSQELVAPPLEEAVELLQFRGGPYASDRVTVRQICEQVERLPLALVLIGGFLTGSKQYAAEYLEWLKQSPYDALDFTGERQHENIWRLLKKSLEAVSEKARQAMALAGLLSLAPFDREPISAAMELPAVEVGPRVLGDLATYGLLDRSGSRYVVAHALIHTYARQELEALPQTINNLTDYFIELAVDLNEQGPEGYARLDPDRRHFLAILNTCVNRQNWEATKILAMTMDNYLNLQGHWTDRVTATRAGIVAAQAQADRRSEGTFMRKLGVTHRQLGNSDEAEETLQDALEIWKKLEDRLGEYDTIMDMGNLYNQLADWSRAIEMFQVAVTGFQELDKPVQEAKALSDLGVAYRRQGDLGNALEKLEESLEIMRKLGDRLGEAKTFHNMGMIYLNQEHWDDAEQVFRKTMKDFRVLNDRDAEAQATAGLGLAYHRQGRRSEAIQKFEQGLSIFEEIGNRYGMGHVLGALGDAYFSLQRWDEAVDVYQKGLKILEEIGDPQGQNQTQKKLGDVYFQQKNWDDALDMYQKAQILTRKLGNSHQEGLLLIEMGRLYEKQGDLEEAVELWEKAKASLRPGSSQYQEVSELLLSK